jgi:BirA family biotin operon repressor/biotin-[acetyl-CoA-carboxylase] ligase
VTPDHQTDRDLDRVLHALVENMTVTVSGERLARDLGVSHSRLVRLVERLRAEGVEILGEPFTGFRLMRLPDVLLPQIVGPQLHSGEIGSRMYHLYATASTNSFAMALADDPEMPHGTVVVAERQTAGRGRRGRHWISVSGLGLYVSMILRPRIPCTLAPLLTLGTAVAIHESLERIARLEVDVKWPNDLLVGERKIAGILSELQAELDEVRSLVIGFGINVNHETMPDEIREVSSSLQIESGQRQSRVEILVDCLSAFERLYADFLRRGPETIVDRWTQSSSFANGRFLEVRDGAACLSGRTDGLNRLGALRLRQPDGRVEEVYSGDVVRWE